jgi:hypothetical protein
MLRMALEGETIEVVEGMFIAVPIGSADDQPNLTEALEELDTAVSQIDEACRVGDVQLYLTGQTPLEGAVATESVKEKVKLVLKKIWALIAKVLAACMALQRGFLEWVRKGFGKKRPLHREVYKAWLDFSVLIRDGMGLWSDAQKMAEDLFANVVKADKLQAKFGAQLNQIQKDMLAKGPYGEAIVKLIGVVCEKDLSNHLREIAKGIGEDYSELQQQATKIDQANSKDVPDGPGTGKDIVPYSRESLDKFSQEVDSTMRLSDARTEQKLSDLMHARDEALKNKHAAGDVQLPENINKAIQLASELGKHMPYELALRYRDEYTKMFADTEKSLAAAEKRFVEPGKMIDERTIENGHLPAQTYLDRATLEAVRAFAKGIQNVAQSYAMIEEHFDAAVGLTETLMDYIIVVLETFGDDFMANRDPRFMQQIHKLKRERDEILNRMNAMKGKK